MTWQRVLEALEARLARLAEERAVHLNVPPAPELAAEFETARAASPQPAPHREPPPEPPPGRLTKAPGGARPRSPFRPAPREQPALATVEGSPSEGTGKHPSELDTLESLHFHFRECQRCGLAATRTKLVFGVGHSKPKLMFIGEGPGHDEDVQGLPFVGRAGQLLTAGIQALGLTRDDVYIANVVKCRPPENRTPAPDEIAACAPILQRQIELLDPALIVVLGNVPLKALHPGARGITAERGRLFEYRQWRALPTYHPAYLLRNPNALENWWGDLKQAFRIAYGGER